MPIRNEDEIHALKSKEKGELTAEEHDRIRDLEADGGPTPNTHRGVQKTGPRKSSSEPRHH